MELLYSKLCILHSTLLTRSSPQWTSRFLTPTYAVLAIWCLNHYLSLCLFFIMILMQFCCLVPIVVVTRMYHKISPICWIYSRLIRYSSGSFSSLDSLEKEKKKSPSGFIIAVSSFQSSAHFWWVYCSSQNLQKQKYPSLLWVLEIGQESSL